MSWTVHKIIEYLTLGLLSSLLNIYHSTTAYFFDPPCTVQSLQSYSTAVSNEVLVEVLNTNARFIFS